MQFNSYMFIMVFLPVVVIGYFGLNKISINVGKIFLMICGIVFYAYGGIDNTYYLFISICINYFGAWALNKYRKYKKMILGSVVCGNILLLFYSKYLLFVGEMMNSLFDMNFNMKSIFLPLGISFFSFQQIMYIVNVYSKSIVKIDFLDYLTYILYFPKLIMGPVVDPKELIDKLNDAKLKSVDWNNISYGLKIFSFGIFKKVILADTFANAVLWGFSNIDVTTSLDWIIIMLCYTFEIYFDFSGYSDMAVGISMLLNIQLPMNFDSPYKALSIRDFWKRWHISLTRFFTKYVYIPLGGSRRGAIRTYANMFVVFLISGLWHGANWTFVLWGGIHGLLNILDRVSENIQRKFVKIIRWALTFLWVNVLWLLFRAESIKQWKEILFKIFSFKDMNVNEKLLSSFQLAETRFIFDVLHLNGVNAVIGGFSMWLFLVAAFAICLVPENNYRRLLHNNIYTMILAIFVFVWSFLCLSSESVFVYFNF